MRVLGFSRKWDKLNNDTFTTFRFRRRDKDWAPGEFVQVVYKPRSKEREILGVALVMTRQRRWVLNAQVLNLTHYGDYFGVKTVREEEAIEDGFKCRADMVDWIGKAHRLRNLTEPMNKLTIGWVNDQ